MTPNKSFFDIWTKSFKMPEGKDGAFGMAYLYALLSNSIGATITALSGTAIAGSFDVTKKIFTRTAGFWIDSQRLTTGAITGTFQVGEAVTQATTSAAGVIARVEEGGSSSYVVIKTITVAQFNGTNIITGTTSGATATPTAVETNLTDLTGQIAFSHVDGTLEGNFKKVVSNTATTLTIDSAAGASDDAVTLFASEELLMESMTIAAKAGPTGLMKAESATTATYTIASNADIPARVVDVDATANVVAVTLPDIRMVDDNQQIKITVINVDNAITVVSPLAAQTLDGDDISSGGTPLATLDAVGDYIIIQRSGLVWVTVQDGIA